MSSSDFDSIYNEPEDSNYVSGRFLTDFFGGLERQGISVIQMLGDLPIPHVESRVVVARVEWPDFVELLKRLEHAVGGSSALESCGANIDEMKYAGALRGLAGLTASPHSLYRAATRWALRRAMPGIDTRVVSIDENRIDIHARLRPGMRPCPQIFHVAAGSARALPRILGLSDAVVEATIEPTAAHYRLTLPPSPTLLARIRRFARAIFSAGSVVHVLEAQQLELHSEHDALRRAHADLAESEERYRAFTDATVDVLCELDTTGHIVFVSASVEELLGYTPEQVTGSHYRLWLPSEFHAVADTTFESLCQPAAGGAFSRKLVALHSAKGHKVLAELSLRCFENALGERRLACVLRDLTDPIANAASERRALANPTTTPSELPVALDRIRLALGEHRSQRPNESVPDATAARDPRRGVLEQSLEILLVALDNHARGSNAQDASGLIRSSDAMTRIVEGVLAAAEGDSIPPRWIETRKLLEGVRLEAMTGPERRHFSVRYRADSIPTEILAHGDLLANGLSSLVEAARLETPDARQIELRLAPGPDLDGVTSLEFSIETFRGTRAPNAGGGDDATLGESGSASADALPSPERAHPAPGVAGADVIALSDAIASDVARAHDGEVVVERHEGGRIVRRLRIPNLA